MDDKRLEQLAARLGADASARLDVEATAQAVLDRLASEPVRVPWWRHVRVLQWAAAAVVILVAGMLLSIGNGQEFALPASPPVVALEELSVDELSEVVDSLGVDAPVYEYVAVGLQDLDEEQLTELLTLMEG